MQDETLPDYSHALRAIGQDLEALGVMIFDLKADGEDFVIQCDSESEPPNSISTFRYTPNKIQQLDRQGRQKRNSAPATYDFETLPNVLRSIGGYVNRRKARLLRLANYESPGTAEVFRIEFETWGGEHVVDDRSSPAVYDFCVSMYKQRGKSRERLF